MKIKTGALVILLLMLTVAVAVRSARRARQQQLPPEQIAKLEEKQKQGRISTREAVQLAKAQGKRRVVVPSLATLYMGTANSPADLDQKLSDYTVVTAQLVNKKSYTYDEAVINTWNKFKVIDTLSQAPPKQTYFSWPAVPEELLPVHEDEVLVHTNGGTVTIEGVEVAQGDADVPAFRQGHKYLLVLSFDPSTRIGWIELGPQALLSINPDDTLDAGNDQHLLQKVISERHGGSINQLRESLRERSHSR